MNTVSLYAMKENGEVDVLTPLILKLALGGFEWSDSRSGFLILGK